MLRFLSLLSIIIIIDFRLYAQHGYSKDVIKFSHNIKGGSARLQAIGGGSVSLGGDVSSISQNPAGLGFVNRKLFSLSYGFMGNNSTSNYLGETLNINKNFNDVENISVILPIKKRNNYYNAGISKCPDCSKFNIGVSYSKIKSFDDRKIYNAYNDFNSIIDYFLAEAQGIPLNRLASVTKISDIALLQEAYDHYLINPDYELPGSYYSFVGGFPFQKEEIITTGHIDKISISSGSNIRDRIFLGFGVNFYSINYKENRIYNENSYEILDNSDQWMLERILDYLTLKDVLKISGNGSSISAGIIIKPTNYLNIGINYESKSSIKLEEESYSELETKYFDYYFQPEDTTLRNVISGTGSNYSKYSYKSPSKLTFGTSYFYKKLGFISVDVDLIDYSSASIQSYDFNDFAENQDIVRIYKSLALNYRIGLEGRLRNFYLRLGYNFLNDPEKEIINFKPSNSIHTKSLGIGFLTNTLSIDLTYLKYKNKSQVSPYILSVDQPIAEFSSNYNKLILSLCIRINN